MDNKDIHVESESVEEVKDPAEATADTPDTGGKKSVFHGEPPRGVTGTASGADASTPGRITMGSPAEVEAAEYDDLDEESGDIGSTLILQEEVEPPEDQEEC